MRKKRITKKILRSRVKRLKEDPTVPEQLFEKRLSRARIRYFTQTIIGFYIVDFMLPDKVAVIEIDGSHHWGSAKQRDHDRKRDEFLKRCGFTMLRIPNYDVRSAFHVEQIEELPDRESWELTAALRKAGLARARTNSQPHYRRLQPQKTLRQHPGVPRAKRRK